MSIYFNNISSSLAICGARSRNHRPRQSMNRVEDVILKRWRDAGNRLPTHSLRSATRTIMTSTRPITVMLGLS